MSSGQLDFSSLQKASERVQQIIDEIDTLELRWLEINE